MPAKGKNFVGASRVSTENDILAFGLLPHVTAAMVRRPNKYENHVVDIFDEVEEDLREERMQQLLKKYGGVLIAICVMAVAATAGWKAWEYRQTQADLRAANLYLSAASKAEAAGVAGTDFPVAIAAFDAATSGAPNGYRVMAQLRAAALRAESGDIRGASAQWDQVAADGSADPLLRDLASLNWCVYHADGSDTGMIEGRLKPLTAPGNPWRTLALEQLALLDVRRGNNDAAKAQFKKLAEDTTAPAGVRGRASALLTRVSE